MKEPYLKFHSRTTHMHLTEMLTVTRRIITNASRTLINTDRVLGVDVRAVSERLESSLNISRIVGVEAIVIEVS
jgi:hypothetical protein